VTVTSGVVVRVLWTVQWDATAASATAFGREVLGNPHSDTDAGYPGGAVGRHVVIGVDVQSVAAQAVAGALSSPRPAGWST